MLETKFTKGDWKTNNDYVWCVGIKICEISEIDTNNKDIEAMANAKLIAAAPDMFNSLKELLEQVKQFTQGNIGEQDYFRDEISNAQKSLNKAVGLIF